MGGAKNGTTIRKKGEISYARTGRKTPEGGGANASRSCLVEGAANCGHARTLACFRQEPLVRLRRCVGISRQTILVEAAEGHPPHTIGTGKVAWLWWDPLEESESLTLLYLLFFFLFPYFSPFVQ